MTRDGETFFFKGIVYEVLLKILKKNVRNSIVCFMSAILVAIMFICLSRS